MSSSTSEAHTSTEFPDADPETPEELLTKAQAFAREMIVEHDMDVDLDYVEWEVDTTDRRKRRAGCCSYKAPSRAETGEPIDWSEYDTTKYKHCTISMTWNAYEEFGWDEYSDVILHELVHAEEVHKFGTSGHSQSTFHPRADEVGTHRHCRKFTEARYKKWCPSCEKVTSSRHRYCKSVRHGLLGWSACRSCGTKVQVKENGEVLPAPHTPDEKVDETNLTSIIGIDEETEEWLNENGVHTIQDVREAIFNNNGDRPYYLFSIDPMEVFEGGEDAVDSIAQLGIVSHGDSWSWDSDSVNNDGNRGRRIYEHYKEVVDWVDGDPTEVFGSIEWMDSL